MKKHLKKLSVLLSMAVFVSSMPFSAFAATNCSHTNLHKDSNGNTIRYVGETESYDLCLDCFGHANATQHEYDGTAACKHCGVSMSADGNGGYQHYHDTTSGTYSYMDTYGHIIACSDSNCIGLFQTHTNMQGTACDYCSWSGPITGAGGGSQGGQPSTQPRFDWDFSQGGFTVPQNGTYTIAVLDGNRPQGTTVDVLLGYVDTDGSFVPYNVQSGLTVTKNSDGIATQAVFDGAVISTTNQLAINNGYFHVAVVVVDSTGVILSSIGCDVHFTCSHQNSWYITEGSYHQACCGDCGAQYGTQDAHTDTDADGRCDVCSVGVAGNVHTHVWSGQWTANNSNTEHFNVCTDGACTMFANVHTAADSNGDGVCDSCNLAVSTGQGGSQGGQPSTQPRFDWDFSQGGFTVPQNGTYTIDVLDGNRPQGTTVDVLLGYVDTDESFVPYNVQSGLTVTKNSDDIATQAVFDGAVISTTNQLAIDNGYFHVAVVVVDSTGVILSSIGCDVHFTCSHEPVMHNGVYDYATEEGQHHRWICSKCWEPYNAVAHTDADADGKCDLCGVTVNSSNVHIHDIDTTKWDFDPNGHFHHCKDERCNYSQDYSDHTDTATVDGKCDTCGYCMNHTAKTDANGNVIFEIWHENHNKICQSCDELFDHGSHTAGADGNCTVCGAVLDANGYHEHNYTWNNTATTHHATCSSCSMVISGNHRYNADMWVIETDRHCQYCEECGMNSGYSDHKDTDNDGRCDGCKVSVAPDANNTLVHTHTSNGMVHIAEVLDHLTECTDCNSGYWEEHYDNTGDGLCDLCNEPIHQHEKRTHGDGSYETVTGEDVHYFVCDSCNNIFDPQPHTDGADDENGRCDVCFSLVTQDSNGNYIHTHTPHPDGLFANSWQHFNRCDTCGMTEYNYADHTDADADGKCDGCGVSVTFSNGSYEHICGSYEWMYEDEHVHIYKCPECDNSQAVQPHIDNCNNADTTVTTPDGLCDVCNVTVQEENGLITHIHQPDNNWQELNSDFHGCECTECDGWVEAPHEDTDVDGKCDDCNGTVTHLMGGYTYHEITKADGTVAKGHAKFCYWCGGIDETTFVEHTAETTVLDGFAAIPDDAAQHAKYCAECIGVVAGTEEKHNDTDGDGYCDECCVNVDQSGQHSHVFALYVYEYDHCTMCEECNYTDEAKTGPHTDNGSGNCSVCNASLDSDGIHVHTDVITGIDEIVHYVECNECGTDLGGINHADYDADGICDGCGFSVDSNAVHHHTPDDNWQGNSGEHYCNCTECGTEIFGEHTDADGNGKCDLCSDVFDTSSGALDAAQLAAAKATFDAAFAKAVNGDTTDLEKLISKNNADDLVTSYKFLESVGDNTTTFITDNVTFIDADSSDAEVVDIVNIFNTSTGNEMQADKLVVFDIGVGFEADMGNYVSLDKYLASQSFEFTVDLNVNNVDADRVWHLYVMDVTSSTPAFTKVVTTEKGASEFTVSSDNFYNEVYVLVYEDVTETPTPTPTPTATPTPAATAAPTATAAPAATAEPTATPEASEEPAEMPAQADTTIAQAEATQEAVEAVKETVTVTEGTAAVDKAAVEAVVQAAEENAPVVLPLTQAAAEGEVVNKAEVDTQALAAVAQEEKDVVIQLTDVTVKLDAKALAAVTEQAEGETIEIRAVKTETTSLTQEQQATLEDVEEVIVISAQIFSNGKYIGDFKGGKATIMVPFEIEEGTSPEDYTVYYVDDKGEMFEVPCEYVNGNMIFSTSHFSEYVIVYQPQTQAETETDVVVTPQEPAQSAGNFPILILIIILAVVVLGAVIFAKRRKTE